MSSFAIQVDLQSALPDLARQKLPSAQAPGSSSVLFSWQWHYFRYPVVRKTGLILSALAVEAANLQAVWNGPSFIVLLLILLLLSFI